ncbi:DUF6603 domain-containing protein [Nonomuraea sp. NPDC050536]|uniref:DUF6603 domain-containing protein n=1 Tax=Nonomuraea sp. NPDC050536 TaxID=3364366 RepID=UPI0037C76E66
MALTISQLRSLLATPDGQLSLSGAQVEAAELFAGHLPGGVLALTGATTDGSAADQVTVTGIGSGVPYAGMGVTLTCTTAGEVTVAGDGPEGWTFARAYPCLAGTIYDTFLFDAPRLVLSTTTGTLTFDGVLRVDTRMALVDLMMPGVTHRVTGSIEMIEVPADLGFAITPVPSMLLLGPEGGALDLGPIAVRNVRYELGVRPWFDSDLIDYVPDASFQVTGEVAFSGGQVLVGALVSSWADAVEFMGDFSEAGEVRLQDIADLVGQALGVPDEIKVAGTVRLGELRVRMTASPFRIASIALTVQTEAEWSLDPYIRLEAIDLLFRVDDPLGSPSVTCMVFGLIGIGESGTLEVMADLTGGSVGGGLRDHDGPLRLREVYAHFTGDPGLHLPDLEVSAFQFGLELPGQGRALGYRGVLRISGTWPVSDLLALTEVSMQIDNRSFLARAGFSVSGITMTLEAAYDSAPDRLWTFSGSTAPEQPLPIGELIDDLAQGFGAMPLPAPIARLTLENLAAAVTTGSGQLVLTGEARFPIDTVEVEIAVAIDTHAQRYGGRLTVTPRGGTPFALEMHFDDQPTAKRFAATAGRAATGPPPPLKELVAALSPTAADFVPEGVAIDLRDLLLAVDDTETGTAYLFALDVAATLDLSRLPLAGEHLTGGFDPLRILAASGPVLSAEVTAINAILPDGVLGLPERDLDAGFCLDGVLRLGPLDTPLALPVGPPAPPAPTQQRAQTGDDVLWHKIQKSFGPVHVERVGLAYRHPQGQSATVALLLDAAVTVGGLTLALDGLRVELSLADLTALPAFGLSGLGLSYSGGPVEISGAFLAGQTVYEGTTYPSYSGKALIRTEELTIAALGSYVQLPVGPSLFVYAFLDYPIGGPAFFYVRGLAAGFGYNRRAELPGVTELADFPLVAEAVGRRTPGTLAGELSALEGYLPPSAGDLFLMIGVHFTTFEMIDSFLLLSASAGHRFELDLLGLSTLILPVPDQSVTATPVAEVQLALRATLVPDDGYFVITAQLTRDSFLLSRDCHLTGGFAFATWFGEQHNGDFVITAGGYHPHFAVPGHYPAVPRLGFSWQVTPSLSMWGSAYYALTPNALMAGGAINVLWAEGALRAWFNASMDFLIAWQPYRYEASFHVEVGASYTFEFFGTQTVEVHVGVDVQLWGPEFGGTATVDLSVVSFTIGFGAGRPAPQGIPWAQFRTACLPEASRIATITVRGGAVPDAQGTGDDLGLINAAELELATESVIPSTVGRSGDALLPVDGARTSFGISPMGLSGGFASTHSVQITSAVKSAESLFTFTPLRRNLPSALWSGVLAADVNAPQLVEDLLVGYVIRPVPPTTSGEPATLSGADLTADTPIFTVTGAFGATAAAEFPSTAGSLDGMADGRAVVVQAVLPGAPLTGDLLRDFYEMPRVSEHD